VHINTGECLFTQELALPLQFCISNPRVQDKLSLTVRICMLDINRVGQNHIYTVCIWYFWQGKHHIYGHIQCIYTVLANRRH
jgi:hypothetical protein